MDNFGIIGDCNGCSDVFNMAQLKQPQQSKQHSPSLPRDRWFIVIFRVSRLEAQKSSLSFQKLPSIKINISIVYFNLSFSLAYRVL